MTSPKPTATVALKHLALSIQTGPFGSQLHAEDYYAGGRPVVNPAHLQDGRIEPDSDVAVDEETFARLAQHELRAGDVVIGRRGELGRCGVVDADQEGWLCGTGSIRLRPNTRKLDARWLRWLLSWSGTRDWLSLASVGTTMENLGAEIVGAMPLPVVDISAQRAIADYLDHETARLDALVAAKVRVLGLLAEKRRALITRAVTRGLDPRAPLRDSGIPWLGDIPLHWRVVQLKFASISLQTGPFGSQLHSEDYVTGGTPVVNPSHLSAGRINADDCVAVDEATANRLALHRLRLGDVVFARRGQMGRCGVVEADNVGWLCGTGSLRARLRLDVVDPYYLALVFAETRISDVLTVQSVGSTMDNLNTEILGSCHVSIPPLTEQRAIVSHIASETTKLDAMRAAIQHTIDLLKERRAALISAAVTGRMQGLS